MTASWSDVLGNYLSASQTLTAYRERRKVGQSLANWIEQQSVDLWSAQGEHDPEEDWIAIAADLRESAAQEKQRGKK